MSRPPDYKAFGARLLQLRAKQGLRTRKAFAAFLEVEVTTLTAWEHGVSYPQYWHVVNIAERCNVGFGWLFTGL